MTITSARRTESDTSDSGVTHRPPVGVDKSLVEWVDRIARQVVADARDIERYLKLFTFLRLDRIDANSSPGGRR